MITFIFDEEESTEDVKVNNIITSISAMCSRALGRRKINRTTVITQKRVEYLNFIRQYIPGLEEPTKYELCLFNTMDDLLEIPFVKKYAERQDFHRFSITGNVLMCETKKGCDWWVVGYIHHTDDLDLPDWKPVNSQGVE